jgi:imidazolonepropionase-like amidohydrolase
MNKIIINNIQILDVRTGKYSSGNVLVEDKKIKEISKSKISDKTSEVIDGKGNFLLPGFCDAHVHVTAATPNFADLMRWSPFYTAFRAEDILEKMLQRGFTTVRDAGGAEYGLAQAINEGYIKGPRLLFCGKAISQTGGHGDMRERGEDFDQCLFCVGLGTVVDGVAEMRRACRDEIRKGANHIKLMCSGGVASPTDRINSTQFSDEEIVAAVQEAEAANLYVLGHAYTGRAITKALNCGVRSIEHGNLMDEQSMDLFVKKNAFLVPTMSTHHAIAREGVKAGMPKEMANKIYDVLDAGQKNFPIAHKKGVKFVLGTDLLGSMHQYQLDEFLLRSEFQSALEVIQSATINAAELFNMSKQIGEVIDGASADLLIYNKDPLDNIKVLLNPNENLIFIMREGNVFKNKI